LGPTGQQWIFNTATGAGTSLNSKSVTYWFQIVLIDGTIIPHRDPMLLQKVAQSLTIVTWREIAQGICAPCATDDEELLSIKRELSRRIQ
jgi:hypothetical protein